MLIFVVVNVLFVAAFVWLIILQPGWPAWVAFIAAWCVADFWFAKEIHLMWWHWALLIAALIAVDLVALRILGQI